jgi:hypothetical protein
MGIWEPPDDLDLADLGVTLDPWRKRNGRRPSQKGHKNYSDPVHLWLRGWATTACGKPVLPPDDEWNSGDPGAVACRNCLKAAGIRKPGEYGLEPGSADLLTTGECASILGVSEARVRQFMLSGRLPSTLGNRAFQALTIRLVARRDLLLFSEEPRVPGHPKGQRRKP